MRQRSSKSMLEEALNIELKHLGVPPFKRQYRFCERRWMFDFAWPQYHVAVEVEGGTWSGGRHTRGEGYAKDCEKYNRAAMDGWMVLRFTGEQVTGGMAIKTIQEVLHKYTEGEDSRASDL